jgi:HD-GYP domain-containing protein (c-di-GMP phosphodiesterase class II)
MRRLNERLFQHSFNTAIIAAVLARLSSYPVDMCHVMALGMAFHDCGQLFLPDNICEKQGKLTEKEMEIARQHPQMGYDYVIKNDILPMEAALIILQHHERPDATGYPQQLKAEEITPLARIAGVVETFDAMTSTRTYTHAFSSQEALRTILGQIDRAFDREMALHLTRLIVLYPEGTAVRFNTGECGIVVGYPRDNPNRPIVRLFIDPNGRRLPSEIIRLDLDPTRQIVQSGACINEVKS